MDEDKPFTVRDRRKFTADGELRGDSEPNPGEHPTEPEAARPSAPPASPGEPPPTGAVADGVDFAGFLMSLASQASVLLSAEEGDRRENLQGARHLIGVLEMLEDKTRGRRSPEEDRLLEQLLYELRMAYVGRSREVGA